MADIVLGSPMTGWATALEEVDDPVFAARMLGDGVAVDPLEGRLVAPCAARVIGVHAAAHAVSLRITDGAELLLHVGLETVGLGGSGFTAHVSEGQVVKSGDLLIAFDLDRVAEGAKSLISPMVVTNGEAFSVVARVIDRRVEEGETLLTLRAVVADAAVVGEAPSGAASRTVTVPLAHGLHARPSALVAAEAKRHRADITLSARGRTANARSPVAVMTLGLGSGDTALIEARGADAEAAVAALAELIVHRLPPEPPAATPPPPATLPAPGAVATGLLQGTPAAPGLAIGRAVRLVAREITVAETSRGPEVELLALNAALQVVRAALAHAAEAGPRAQREIVAAHLAFLDDADLIGAAEDAITSGAPAGAAWRGAIRTQVEALRGVSDRLIAQRADDLIDLERQVLTELAGETEARQVLPAGAIVLADDLGPGQLMALEGGLIGICTGGGGPTSHVAILANAMNIPAVVAMGPTLGGIAEGATLILDGGAGTLRVAPDAAELEAAQTRLAVRQQRLAEARAEAAEVCRTADGTRIEVFANLGSTADADAAAANGAEGCGLLRTEFLFLERETAPDEEEQRAAYQAIAKALPGLPIVVRTLDIGGDKPIPFLDLAREENPALGLRGVRVSLARRDLLDIQLRAILAVRPEGQCRILVPMVASLAELLAVKVGVEAAQAAIRYQGSVQIGVMIETPAAAITADILAAHADFLSIGTNDLTQYGLAMDRGNPAVAAGIDALHPAILRLIAATTRGAAAHNKPVAVCGGLAADPNAAAVLIGLGVGELSAPPAAIPEIKAAVRRLTLDACRALAERCLACKGPAEVRAEIAAFAGET